MHLGFDVILSSEGIAGRPRDKARQHLVAPDIIAALKVLSGEMEGDVTLYGQKRGLGPPHSLARKR